eukprot:gene8839-9018_t
MEGTAAALTSGERHHDDRSGSGTDRSSGGLVHGSSASVSERFRGSSGLPALLKARSDMAVLRDLKIGPLLGRGSYGRVYKGRWKAVTVAVKIIEHHEASPDTAASSNEKRVCVGREAFLATSILHPNVVQTYHISTMTVAQRNALAASWLKEKESKASSRAARGSSSGNVLKGLAAAGGVSAGPSQPGSGIPTGEGANEAGAAAGSAGGEQLEAAEDERSDDGSSTNSDTGEEPPELTETWMIMEFCEKGSLERAISHGTFIRRCDRQPEMIGIYKALLDTASGLDFLHSIGVLHGDLKAANVLLKGSTRDVRGFACKITDFGLSRVLDIDATHISTRTYGTIVYMPSELLLQGRMTQATDIYSFGLMMWELISSQRVFDDSVSIGQIFYMVAYQGWRPTIPANCPTGAGTPPRHSAASGGSGSSYTHPFSAAGAGSFNLRDWGSVSTGTLPSVLGGGSQLNLLAHSTPSRVGSTGGGLLGGSAGQLQTVEEHPPGQHSELSSMEDVRIAQPMLLLQQQQLASLQADQQGPQEPPRRASTPPLSPFAALAQRAGSLFAPLRD